MKRLLIALLVCVYIATAVFSAVLPVTSLADELDPTGTTAATETTETTENSETTESTEASENTEATQTTEATDPVEETVPVEEDPAIQPMDLTWMKYTDYLAAELAKDEADPARNVGREAVFYVGYWQTFICAANPLNPAAGQGFFSHTALEDEYGKSIQVKITDYVVDNDGSLWYKVEALEGETLPAVMDGKPYIIHLDKLQDVNKPTLLIVPQKAMFVGETVSILNLPVAATKSVELETANLPVFFDVIPAGGYWEEGKYWREGSWCELIDTTGWSDLLTEEYRYVTEDSVILIPPEVTVAYETLLKAESAEEYEQIWDQLPETVRNKFTDRHLEDLNNRQEELNNVTHSGNVIYNGQTLEVSVSGRIPENVTLSVAPVSYETVVEEGFDVSNTTDLITALDIKLLNPNGTEWQPADGEYLYLNIDMAALGVPDGKVVRLHHKHDGVINVQDVFIVMNGKLNIRTTGFSIYVVDDIGNTDRSQQIDTSNPYTPVTVNIGETIYLYYYAETTNWWGDPTPWNGNGTWVVNDPTGAIHYTVHSDNDNSEAIGHNQVCARWIKIVGLKETSAPITIIFNRGDTTEECRLSVTVPHAEPGKKRLYIKDMVNTTGCLVATVVDENGNEVSLDGAAFNWSRYDEKNGTTYVVPPAYEDGYRAVNIARDHGGLVEARKNDTRYLPTIYTVEVILADGTELEESYTVYYQSEIINAGFEFPDAHPSTYNFFPNGYPELYWKTTAPGTGTGNITKDVEYADVTGQSDGGANYSVKYAADYDPKTNTGYQFAELNAELVGALYQDIITAPGEDIEWKFAHAKRESARANKMYLVIGATENAQALTNAQLNTLVREARQKVGNNQKFLDCEEPYKLTFSVDGKEYWVWYHDADDQTDYSAAANYGWEEISGSYAVPELPDDPDAVGQYRTRVFFVSDPDASTTANYGNLIDVASAGQYKDYLIEYYEQTYENGVLVTKRIDDRQEKGRALVYSSAELKNYDYFIETEHDYLYKIIINGENYPYDISYSGKAALYIEKYKGAAQDLLEQGKSYEGVDIVMQVVLRDTVIAVQKELQFPSTLTEEQKLTIIEELNKKGSYQATFMLDSPDPDDSFKDGQGYTAEIKSAYITSRDPAGKYKGFVALGDNPELGHNYQVEETFTTEIPGLELEEVTFGVTRYSMGKEWDTMEKATYDETKIKNGEEPLVSAEIRLEGTIKIADVAVTNAYKEKITTIEYKAIGNGKVALTGSTDFVDIPTEQLPFYSGKSVGAEIHKGNGASFEGWYLDEACTQKVPVGTSQYGVVESDGTFKPNANIINADKVTFYAKFTTGTIVIERSNAEPGQSFVYHVTGTTTGGKSVDLYVTVVCNESGYGKTEVLEVLTGTYTVTEVEDWSWRYDAGASQTITHNGGVMTTSFGGNIDRPNWLSGLAEIAKNIFTKVRTTP